LRSTPFSSTEHAEGPPPQSSFPWQGIAVPDDPPPDETPNCDKCGQPTALVTVIGRLGKVPAYRIFRCNACEALQWVAEKIAGGDESA
jgi:hypothetical protein